MPGQWIKRQVPESKQKQNNKNNRVLKEGYCQYLIDKGQPLFWTTAMGNLELEI